MSDARFITDLVVAGSVFGLALTVWLMFVLIWTLRRSAKNEKVEKRLELTDPQNEDARVLRLWRDGKEVTTAIEDEHHRLSTWERVDQVRQNAGWAVPLRTIILGLLSATTLIAGIFLTFSHSLLGTVTVAVAIVFIFWTYVKRRIDQREALFERQFVEAIGLASRSLRAGHPLTSAFQLISEEIAPPVGETFKKICQQQAFGVSMEKAIRDTASASRSHDMRMFSTSVIMQLSSGGNLADMMERLAMVIRDRMQLNRRVRIITAQTQFSKRVLLALPIVVFVSLNSLNPDYMEPLYTTNPGKVMVALGGAGLLLGAWVMNRIGKVHY